MRLGWVFCGTLGLLGLIGYTCSRKDLPYLGFLYVSLSYIYIYIYIYIIEREIDIDVDMVTQNGRSFGPQVGFRDSFVLNALILRQAPTSGSLAI